MANLRLSNFHLNQGMERDGRIYHGRVHATDLVDSFHLFRYTALAEFLCVGQAVRAGDVGATHVMEPDGKLRRVHLDELVFC